MRKAFPQIPRLFPAPVHQCGSRAKKARFPEGNRVFAVSVLLCQAFAAFCAGFVVFPFC